MADERVWKIFVSGDQATLIHRSDPPEQPTSDLFEFDPGVALEDHWGKPGVSCALRLLVTMAFRKGHAQEERWGGPEITKNWPFLDGSMGNPAVKTSVLALWDRAHTLGEDYAST